MNLFIVRHGKTIWNKDNRLQGSQNIPLTDEGREAAINLGQSLKNISFLKVFSSPLDRAYETAQLIFKNSSIQIIKDENLREVSFGDMEGHTYDEMEKLPSNFKYFFTEPDKFQPVNNGESLEHLCLRTKNFIQTVIEPIYKTNPDANLMIVAHGALNKSIMCYLENHGLKDFWKDGLQKNCQATIYQYDGKTWTKK